MKTFSKLFIALIAIFTFSQLVTTNANAKTFPDVDPTSEVGIAVEKLSTLGVVSGRPSGFFAPDDKITRAEAAKIMYGILGLEQYANETGEQTFPDVALDHWAYKQISTISEWKVMNGHTNGYFGPNDNLTRGQMAVVLQNGLGLADGPANLPFTDVPADAYYKKAVASLYAANITKGKTTTTYAPEGFVTRAELALFLDRSGILDELLGQDPEFDIIDIAQVDGQILEEVRFRQILTKLKNEIWLINPTDYEDETYFDDTTFTFENLHPGEVIFEVNFNSFDSPIYLKIIVSDDEQVQYQFKTPRTLSTEADTFVGTAQLASIIQAISTSQNIDPTYLNHYITSPDNEMGHYFAHVGGYTFYVEFKNLTPFTLYFDTPKGTKEIYITPYANYSNIDYTAKLIQN